MIGIEEKKKRKEENDRLPNNQVASGVVRVE